MFLVLLVLMVLVPFHGQSRSFDYFPQIFHFDIEKSGGKIEKMKSLDRFADSQTTTSSSSTFSTTKKSRSTTRPTKPPYNNYSRIYKHILNENINSQYSIPVGWTEDKVKVNVTFTVLSLAPMKANPHLLEVKMRVEEVYLWKSYADVEANPSL